MSRLRVNVLAALIVIICVISYLPYAPVRLYDFRAFYCAGKAVAAHADPYREHPLHECEWTSFVPGMPVEADIVTVPAPVPGYVLAIFALLARLPFGVCAALWIAASLGAVLATIVLLARSIAVSLNTVGVTLLLPAAIVAIPLGQLAPFIGLGIGLCAYGLVHGRTKLATVGALLTALSPPIAIVLCATLVIAWPASRVLLVAGTVTLVAISIVTLGLGTNVEYLSVLGAHASGNVAERSQFSTTHFAWVAGFAASWALVLGKVWYGVSALAGILIAVRLRKTYGNVALALVPPAFAVFGGLYVHFDQVVLAIPAYLMICARAPSTQPWLVTAIYVLAVPWLALVAFPPFAVALIILAVVYAHRLGGTALGLRLGFGSAGLLIGFFAIALATIHPTAAVFRFESTANPLAEISWSRYVSWRDARPNWIFLALQVPTVLAFVTCLAWVVRRSSTRIEPVAG